MRIAIISRSTLFTAPGGDTVQITETAKALAKKGIKVEIKLADESLNYRDYNLLHFFNIIRPNVILKHIKKADIPFVVSTIFVDYSEVEQKNRGFVYSSLARLLGPDRMEYLKTIARYLVNGEPLHDYSYIFKGHKKSVELLLNSAAILLPNSHSEYNRLKKRYYFQNDYQKVPNAVSTLFLNEQVEGLKKKGVICVARIEPIKNQLNLIKAVKNKDIELSIIGKAAPNHQKYYDQCRKEAGSNVRFYPHLSVEDTISMMDRAKVHVLPSWFETTGLSSLEAACRNCNIVLSPKGDTEEYFQDQAYYCDPENEMSIWTAIDKANKAPYNPALKNRIAENYTWEKVAECSLSAYHKVLNKFAPNDSQLP